MADRILASFAHPTLAKVSTAVIDNGRAGYLCFYEGVRKKEECGTAWIYNLPSSVGQGSLETDSCDVTEHEPMPSDLLGPSGVCAAPVRSQWLLIWDQESNGCVLLQDGTPVVLEDPRTEDTFCAGLSRVFDAWNWQPMPPGMIQILADAIHPSVKRDGNRLVLPNGADTLAYRLTLPELPQQRIKYGRPKHMSRIKLNDVLQHPIWVGMVEDDRYTEEHERPIVSQSDVDDVLLRMVHPSLWITLKVLDVDLYASGRLSTDGNALDELVVWNGKKWASLDALKGLVVPVVLIAIPSLRGIRAARFTCTSLASGKARRTPSAKS